MSDDIHIKSAAEIELMREAGRLLAKVFKHLDNIVKEDTTTMAINNEVERYIRQELQARPASLGQYGYPYVLNASVNEVVCHGMPKEHYALRPRDIINLDITLEKNGFIADSSKMYVMPQCWPRSSPLSKRNL